MNIILEGGKYYVYFQWKSNRCNWSTQVLGSASAKRFLREGAKVIAIDLQEDKVNHSLSSEGSNVITIDGDISSSFVLIQYIQVELILK